MHCTILMIVVTRHILSPLVRLYAHYSASELRRVKEKGNIRTSDWPTFLCNRDGIRVFVQIRAQVGHSGQCWYFIPASVRPSVRFLVSVYSTIRNGLYALAETIKTQRCLYTLSRPQIFFLWTHPRLSFDFKLGETEKAAGRAFEISLRWDIKKICNENPEAVTF